MNPNFTHNDSDISREAVINRLEGVVASKVIEKEGAVEEIHVLVDKSRSPKQVSRDVQSTFAAWFGESVDHRKISVAQMDGFKTKKTARGRINFDKMTTQTETDGRLDISVSLSYEDLESTGQLDAYVGRKGRLKLVSDATLIALRKMFDMRIGLTLEDVQKTQIAGEEIVNVAVLMTKGMEESLLLGAVFVEDSDLEATVKATLDAVNRRLPSILY